MKTFLAVVACCLVVLGNCRGAISFDLVTWDAGDGEFNWVSRDGVATVANTGGTLGMDFDALENTDSMQNATDYTGDYTAYSNLKVSFDWLGMRARLNRFFLSRLREAVRRGSMCSPAPALFSLTRSASPVQRGGTKLPLRVTPSSCLCKTSI